MPLGYPANQTETVKIVIDAIVNEGVVSNPNVLYNAVNTFVGTTIPGINGVSVISAKYNATVYPKPGEATFVPAGAGNN